MRDGMLEYELNMKGVRDVFKSFLFEINTDIRDKQDVEQILTRMLKLKYSKSCPRKPPRIIMLGPPGSGRST